MVPFRITLIIFIIVCAGVICSLGDSIENAAHKRRRREYLQDISMFYIGSVKPDDWVLRMETARSGYFYSSYHPECIMVNIGKLKLDVKMIYGSVAQWFYGYPLIVVTIEPGETKILPAEGLFAATAVEINNRQGTRGMFYGSRGIFSRGLNQPASKWAHVIPFETAIPNVLQSIASHNYTMGDTAQILYDTIFPSAQIDAWPELKNKIEQRLTSNMAFSVNTILDNDIKPLKAKIRNFVTTIDNPLAHDVYLDIIYKLNINYEKKFYFSDSGKNKENVNHYIIPLYARVVNMKVFLYTFGLAYKDDLRLMKYEIDLITTYRRNLIEDAISHIARVKTEKLDYEYDTLNPDYFYEKLMQVRTEAAVHGEYYIPYWQKIIDPDNQPTINDTGIAYSNYFGISTPKMYLQALVNMGEEPLTPRIIEVSKDEVKRIALQSIEVHYNTSSSRNEICGMTLIFENDVKHFLGSKGDNSDDLKLMDKKIGSLEVNGGTETIDCLNFMLTDGSSKQFGYDCKNQQQTFELEGHYISSLFIAQDNGRTDGRVVNIAVSYQRLYSNNSTNADE